ncbi:tRNA (N(6)-L-threonylcarbamoyladenosine(37)-C(2))-methylthiotransferase MtaB [Magnetovirga frankeli]|uniref:tRNA (N(6)-L-threonylcarbamoyladenosine(37)-C(2))- methylthiotransferase MtaB n=1 Tax=Magnetovirga frankeli TaxID=947516 RepID=UPI001293414D|nr:tRNA (N(6)-L-threonylcarbamoyladenosine(37)-C(2))-methylthiotransferase MtaB [gamma proteobacterium SS-5]
MILHLSSLGCRLNEAELETWARQFQQRGHVLSPDPQQADLLVVNTCAVTDEAVRKSRKLLRRAQRDNPSARLVVSGCYASLNPQESASLPGVDLLIDNRDKPRLVELVCQQLDLPLMPTSAAEAEASPFRRGRQRAFIKVQDGCRYRCSYCIVTLARGEERSRPAGEIIDEINALQHQGIQEAVLAGVHLGGYGSDTGSSLTQLIGQVLRETDLPRLRLGSLEPWGLSADFWALFADPRLLPHLHLPLQSGARSVLRRMARRCDPASYRQLVAEARAAVAGFNITTDIIVGFPGESEPEWRQTLEFCAEIGFGHIHIFAFSPRQGSKAATLPQQIPTEIKRQRSKQLEQLAVQGRERLLRDQVGRRVQVLMEGKQADAQGYWWGYTPNYLRLALPTEHGLELGNRILEVDITGWQGGHLLGEQRTEVGD